MTAHAPPAFFETVLRDGKVAAREFTELNGQRFRVSRGPLSTIALDDEWYEDLRDPAALVAALRERPALKVDLLSFWQRVPHQVRQFGYACEPVELAVLDVSTHEHWFNTQLKSNRRTQLRAATRKGLQLRVTEFDDDFVRGITRLFNESPMRQGRPFWHFGKSEDTVRAQFSAYLHRETLIGAYFGDDLVGFVMLGDAGRFALPGQIVASLEHRDKQVSLALISKAVEVCEQRGLEHLVYYFWGNDSLTDFKRRCAFYKMSVPRYYVPLTPKGALALRVGAHRGLRAMLPESVKAPLKTLRRRWYESRRPGPAGNRAA